MEFRVLGPIEVWDGNVPRPITPGRQTALLALLLVRANQVVSTDRILDALWGDDPPESGAKTVGFHVSKLRDALAPERARNRRADDAPGALRTVDGGYLLRVDPEALDAARFEGLAADGRRLLAQDVVAAAAILDAALAEWHGPAYAQVADESFAQAEIARLEELRLRVAEDSFDAALAVGRHEEVLAPLGAHVAANPLREHARASLMTALYRAGRQSEALRTYAEGRAALSAELGIEPGPELRLMEQLVLQQDARLDPPMLPGATIRNPYKGLRPFGESDAPDFFGRETLVASLLDRLGQVARGQRLLLLIGPSGSGKSSVALAGIMPALKAGALPALAGAPIQLLMPGLRPDQDLMAALEAVKEAGAARTVLVVDQLDELPAVAGIEATAAFLAGLEHALAADDPGLVVIATLRADRLDLPLAVPGLAARVRTGTEIVAPLMRDEIERAVSRPAERVGLRVEPGLPEAIAVDVGTQPGALPLLQIALTELFERRDGDRLTRAAYLAAGGVAGALAARAEDAWAALDTSDRAVARQMFLHLVAIGESGEPAGRRRSRADLEPLADDEVALDRVLDVLTRRRLLAVDRDTTSGEPVVAIAHDALLTHWPRLAGWVRETRDDLAMRRRLADATADWEAAARDPGFLLTGARLDLFVAWAATTHLRLPARERTLLDASLADRRMAEEAELARAGRERRLEQRASTRLRALAAVLTAGILVASTLSIALYRQGEAAVEEARIAVARERAAAAIGTLGSDPRLALQLAWYAADATADLGYVASEAYDSLQWSLQALHTTYPADPTATAVRTGPDGLAGMPLLTPEELMAMAAAAGLPPLDTDDCRAYLHQDTCPSPTPPRSGGQPGLAVLHGGRTEPVAALATQGLGGTAVDVVSQLPVDVSAALSALVSGAGVTVRTTHDPGGTALGERLAAGLEPDIAIVAAPRTMADLAADGRLIDLGGLFPEPLPAASGSAYLDGLMRVGSDGSWPAPGGSSLGVPFALTDESLLWANPGEASSVISPNSWESVIANTQRAVAAGRAGWCLGVEGNAAGIDDLLGVFEDGLLDVGGADGYDAWASGDLQTGRARAVEAFARVSQLSAPSAVLGGIESALHIPPQWAAWPMFRSPSPCVYHPGGGQERLDWPQDRGRGLTAIPVPGRTGTARGPVRGRAYVVVVLHDRPEVRTLLQALLAPQDGGAALTLLDDAGLWRPGAPGGPEPDRGRLAAALADDTFRVRLEDTLPTPVADALAEGMASYWTSGDEAFSLLLGGIRQAWTQVSLREGG